MHEQAWFPVLIAIACFLADVLTPRGIGDAFWYIIPVIGCLWIPSKQAPWIAACLLTPLFVVGFYLSPPGVVPDHVVAINRVFAFIIMLIAAALVSRWASFRLALEDVSRQLRLEHQRKDVFLATLAHELRNPLAALRNAAAILKHSDASADARRTATGVLDRQVRIMARLLDELMDVSRISKGKLLLQKQHVDLRQVIDNALEISSPAIAARGHQLLVEPTVSAPIEVDADPVRLSQAIANLLTNAAKYTPRGGRIDLNIEVREPLVEIKVRDSGIGLDAQSRAKVFDVFYQVPSAPDCPEGGLGIGLALVKAFIELHGGSVEVRSDGVGTGCEFTILLPLSEGGHAVTDSGCALPARRNRRHEAL